MKVDNEEVKQQIQNKEVLGFSIEGNFLAEKEMYMHSHEEFAALLDEINNLLKKD